MAVLSADCNTSQCYIMLDVLSYLIYIPFPSSLVKIWIKDFGCLQLQKYKYNTFKCYCIKPVDFYENKSHFYIQNDYNLVYRCACKGLSRQIHIHAKHLTDT